MFLADTLFGEMSFTTLLEPVYGSSTQVPLFMPRHLQPWYSREYLSCAVIPTGVRESVARVLLFTTVYQLHL